MEGGRGKDRQGGEEQGEGGRGKGDVGITNSHKFL